MVSSYYVPGNAHSYRQFVIDTMRSEEVPRLGLVTCKIQLLYVTN